MNKSFNKTLLALSLLGMLAPATVGLAEDIDIYKSSSGDSDKPNILVVIDNSANWANAAQHWPGGIKQGQAELSALRTVISDLNEDIKLGLMMFTPGSGSAKDGGYVRFKIRTMDSTNKAAFQAMLGDPAGCTNASNSLNNTPNCIYQNFSGGALNESVGTAKTDYSAVMYEVFKYFGGYTSPAHANDGVAGAPTDASHFGNYRYAGDPESRADYQAYQQVCGTESPENCADSPRTDLTYHSPLSTGNSCSKNFVIFIGNGYPTQDSPSSLLTGVGGDATSLAVPDFTVTPTVTQTLLSTTALGTYTGDAAGQAACEAAAATTYGAAYASYTCAIASSSSSTATTALATTTCGAYADAASCTTSETTAYAATYDSVTCALSGDACAAGTTALTNTACGLGATAGTYASAAACTTAETTANLATYPGGVTCTQIAGNCSYTTSTGTQTSACRADVASCNANAATDYPGSPAWSSQSCGAVVTANCTYAAAATQNFCASSAANCSTLATAAGFNAGFTTDYTSTNCVPNVGGSKQCNVTGTKNVSTGNTYTITGTATSAAGLSFSRVGSGAPTYSFSRTGSKTTTTYSYNIYGNYTTNTMVPTGTYTGTSANYADEWARFLNKTDLGSATGQQNAITYTIDVFKDAQDADQTKLLMSMASNGGGKYFTATDETAIKDALRKIFAEIQSVNSVFASSSLPVSVNTQGTYLNQVFMGMFRPDGGKKPRWAGNLKQYKFKVFADGVMRLSDKNNEEAISSTTGFIAPCADSFWTTDSGDYWNYAPRTAKGNCAAQASLFSADLTSYYSDAPDGDVVEKGGAAQRLRGVTGVAIDATHPLGAQTSTNYSSRALKTCDGSTTTSCTAFTDFLDTNLAIAGAAGVVPFNVAVAEVNPLINWVRGRDLLNENGGIVADVTAEMRPSVHGGVVHSQPAVVDYGGATGVISFYGADDGVFHAIDGHGLPDPGGTGGNELWGFIAPETFSRLYRLKDNGGTTNLIPFPADTVSGTVAAGYARKDYFFDGGIGVYQKDATVWIYPSMRRGGRAIYAFDVSTPDSPTIKWRRGCFTNLTSDDTNCSTGWDGIGQTWSKPTLGYLSGYVSSGNPKPVLIFGGGYDQCEDRNLNTSSGCGTKGAQVWFVDADTGAIIRTFPTRASVPGDISLLTDTSGYVTYVYAADTKGYVSRIKVGTFNGTTLTKDSTDAAFVAAGWSSTTLGATDIAYLSETNHPRKFLSGPNVVQFANYNAVMIGSGDREHPMKDSYACGNFAADAVPPDSPAAGTYVTNQFYMLMDQPTASPAPAMVLASSSDSAIGLVNVTSGVSTTATTGTTTTLTNVTGGVTTTSTRGWRFNFGTCEQSVNKPLTIGGVTYFGTNAPTSTTSACQANIGIAKGYAVDFATGNPVGAERSATFTGGGMPPSPVAGVVDVDGVKLPFIIGGVDTDAANQSALQGSRVTIEPTGARARVFWYIQTD